MPIKSGRQSKKIWVLHKIESILNCLGHPLNMIWMGREGHNIVGNFFKRTLMPNSTFMFLIKKVCSKMKIRTLFFNSYRQFNLTFACLSRWWYTRWRRTQWRVIWMCSVRWFMFWTSWFDCEWTILCSTRTRFSLRLFSSNSSSSRLVKSGMFLLLSSL